MIPGMIQEAADMVFAAADATCPPTQATSTP